MNRRNFLWNGSLAGLSVSAFSLGACKESKKGAESSVKDIASPQDSFPLMEITIEDLQQKMKEGSMTAVSITQLYLDRILQIDKSGPKLNSIIEINPDALSIAAEMDNERKAGNIRGSLHGIPVLIKDNIDTADKMQTTAGSLALEGHIAKEDAFIVKQLRLAGAVILGKTNLSEWANFRSTSSCSGWSSRGGQTKSAYLLTHNPCGSSSGSGVAPSANLCVVAIGTETDGSITCPAAVSGIVGLKPTVGLVSRTGIIPISHTQDTAGPMARTVRDTAILLGVLTGIDENDEITRTSEGKKLEDYTKFLDTEGLKGKRIGIEKELPGKNHYMHALLAKAKDVLRSKGAEVIEVSYLKRINDLGNDEYNVLKYEFKAGLNKYLANANAKIKSLKEVIEFNKANEDRAMPYFKQETLEACEALGTLDTKEYKDALKNSHKGSQVIIDGILKEHKLDAISGLTMGPACSIDLWYGDRWGDVFLTAPAASSGYPHITVPCGMVYGLPVGLSFYGPAYSEPTLLSLAYSYEQATKNRQLPTYKTQLESLS
ncbi:amidase [Flavihumibacter sp. ZG627]|uniref:amidase n=1 Tax=Flavihumibacter sp. ZG627 TaxID=1463156 RepID=UPI00057D871E|nr:amidase [Flavihumibacter sp. ZG627]KIC90042.1 amidase [Flavihumibacter sp. ZG627]